jgi:hypothetical protein
MSVIKGANLDLSKITFSDVKTDMHGRKMVYVNLNNGKILVQTPKMYAPNGLKRWRKKDAIDNTDDKFELELSFYGEDGANKNAEEIRQFHQNLQEFDELIKRKVIEKAKEWLSMPKLDMNTLESVMYTPMVRVPKDKEGNELPYPSRVRVKIDRDLDTEGNASGRFLSNKRFKTEIMVFDENKEQLQINEDNAETVIPKGTQVVSIMELVYLSLSKTTISTKWKLVQAKVFRNKNAITSYAMLDDDAESTPADLDTEPKAKAGVDVAADDSDDDSDVAVDAEDDVVESESEESVQVKPKPRVKRGTVSAKATK